MSSARTGITSASAAMPALPGAQRIRGRPGDRASALTRACSRPPPPTTSTVRLTPALSHTARSADPPRAGRPLPWEPEMTDRREPLSRAEREAHRAVLEEALTDLVESPDPH